ncbi:flavin reductase family protein [Streptomyces sp. NPDC085466]|uniref:flavin reductase family protein n=1 Tax=Streptomyces sp. NPDC085466 TaxID=3365725 RepID=UPI0037D750B1
MSDLDAFAEVLDPPVYVVTGAAGDGERAGCLVGFASQCSIRPARFTVWLSRRNHTYRVALRSTRLAVHVLSRTELGIARLFGEETGDETDKFARVDWEPGPGGVPVLSGARAWFVGGVRDRWDGGDHVGFLLAPVAEVSAAVPGDDRTRPLRLSDVSHFTPGHPA